MKKILVTEEQLEQLKKRLKEESSNDDMDISTAKEKLFNIAILAHKMWESMDGEKELEDWMKSKISQAEQSIVNVAKSHMYGEEEHQAKGMDELDFDDLIIGN